MKSWNLEFAARQFGRMSITSMFRYRKHLIRARAGAVTEGELLCLDLRRPVRGPLWLREAGSDQVTYDEVMEAEVYAPAVRAVQNCEWIIDLGANVGLASRYFLEQFPTARLLALEPDASSYLILQRNLSVVGERAVAVRGAIWGSTRPLALSRPNGELRFDCVRVQEAFADSQSAPETVDGFSVKELCRRYQVPRIDLLKVDIEGAEVELFCGETDWLKTVGTIAIEFHGSSRADARFDDVVSRHGFVIDDSNPHTVIARRA